MLKIGIDARLYNQTGVGVYLRNLLHYLELENKDKFIFYIYLLQEDYDNINFNNKNFVKRVSKSKWHTFSEQIELKKLLYKDNLDLMHFTYFSYPVLYKRKFVATIHDTTPLTFKTGKASTKNPIFYELKFRAFKFVLSEQVKNAEYIITPTQTVKTQLLDIYGKKHANKIRPIYEGIDYELKTVGHSRESGNPESKTGFPIGSGMTSGKNFFIYIGNFYPHKNVENLIKAYSQVKSGSKLILIGPDDFFAKRMTQLINQLSQNKRIFLYHNPTKQDLVFFYKNALALIHPSLSEGFGLPIVEAMYFGLPIIASDNEVFQEIIDSYYISFDPQDPIDIAKKIDRFNRGGNKFDYSKAIAKFSFKKMTDATLNLYNQALD